VIADYHAVGLSVAGHPMGRYRPWCRRVGALASADLARCRGGERVLAAGLVITRQRPTTAKGTTFLLLEDEHGTANVIVPPKVDARDREATRHGAFVVVYGRAERDGPLVNVVARRVEAFGPGVLRGAATDADRARADGAPVARAERGARAAAGAPLARLPVGGGAPRGRPAPPPRAPPPRA
jgi:error-prone DNA polymerase